MTQEQHFKVTHKGKVEGGTAHYVADLLVGSLSWDVDVTVGALFIHDEEKKSGTFQLPDPTVLLSARFTPGAVVPIGQAVFTVRDVQNGKAQVDVVVQGAQVQGTAIVDVSAQYVRLLSLTGTAKVSVFSLDLQVEEV